MSLNGKYYLTVFSDASYCPKTGATGIASWARGDGNHRAKAFFFLPMPLANSQLAELFAFCHGILLCISELPHEPGYIISAQTDCLDVIRMMKYPDSCASEAAAICLHVLEEVKKNGLILTYKHIKAHTGEKDPRSKINHWCDYHARNEMRKKREILKNDQYRTAPSKS